MYISWYIAGLRKKMKWYLKFKYGYQMLSSLIIDWYRHFCAIFWMMARTAKSLKQIDSVNVDVRSCTVVWSRFNSWRGKTWSWRRKWRIWSGWSTRPYYKITNRPRGRRVSVLLRSSITVYHWLVFYNFFFTLLFFIHFFFFHFFFSHFVFFNWIPYVSHLKCYYISWRWSIDLYP